MKRIIYMVLMNLLHVPAWFVQTVRMSRPDDKHTIQERYDKIAAMVKRVIKRGRVTVTAYGAENIPDQNGFILFPNHQGLFDVLALFATCPKPLSFVIKKEASNWILVKQILGATRSLSMDRSDIKDQVKTIGEVTNQVKQGRNFVIFAEGHRSRNENEILEFKSGTFKSAIKAGCPIIPVALINSFRPFDINTLKREQVEVHYMEPIVSQQYAGLKTSEIADIVHDRIQEKINENVAEKALTS